MNKVKVAAISCEDYSEVSVENAVESVLSQLGGIETLVSKDAKVFVKLNLVRDMPPEKCGTTHPEVVVALCRQLEKVTTNVTVGDSCAGMYTKSVLSGVYGKCGLNQIEQRCSASLNQNFDSRVVKIDGVALSDCDVISAFLDADVVINVCKLKTHSFAGYSGAVKNLYGLIPGLVKVEMHSRFPQLADFCNLLCDLEQFARPKIVLHLMDAVWGMDGEGPTNGKPKFIGQILASQNPYALDTAAVSLFSDNPLQMPVLQTAAKRGFFGCNREEIDFDFDAFKRNFIADFDFAPAENVSFFADMSPVIARLTKYMTKKVYMDGTCRACGKCVQHCPAKAINIVKKRARVAQKKCIHCYCCQELCPFNAVRFKKPLLYKLARKLSGQRNNK